LKPNDNVMIWFAPRIGYDHDPIIISAEEAEAKRKGGQDAIDQDLLGEPFINYICSGKIDSSIELKEAKTENYKERIDLNFIENPASYQAMVKDLTKVEQLPGTMNWFTFE
jgi:hypothetical protein